MRRSQGAAVLLACTLLVALPAVRAAGPDGPGDTFDPERESGLVYDPPVAALIAFGEPNDLGEAQVIGEPGSVLPRGVVYLVNLASNHQAYAFANADGSFTAKIFAPPGSPIMIKHGSRSGEQFHRWGSLSTGMAEGINPYPGTILHVPYDTTPTSSGTPFATAGTIESFADDAGETRNTVSSAWSLEGLFGVTPQAGSWSRIVAGTIGGKTSGALFIGGYNWSHPALGDLDGDGDPDLLVGSDSGTMALYVNRTGDSGYTDGNPWAFEADGYAGLRETHWIHPALGDFDKDGRIDLAVGTDEGTVEIYRNEGSATSAAWPVTPTATVHAGQSPSPTFADIDGDGDPDLLIGSDESRLACFENTGRTGTNRWSENTRLFANVENEGGQHPALVDLDGDGDLDLLVGLCGQITWYRRGGTRSSPTWTRVESDPIGFGGGSCGVSPTAGDWDQDGDIDLVFGEHWGVLRFFERRGASSWRESSPFLTLDLQGETGPALGDLDADGDLDLLVGQAHGSIYRLTNVGTATSPAWRLEPDPVLTLPWTNHPHAFPALVDIDGDGDLDLFVGEGGYEEPFEESGGTIRFYRNDGSVWFPFWNLVTDRYAEVDVGGWSVPAFADVDDDGDYDLFVGSADGAIARFENSGTAAGAEWTRKEAIPAGRYSAPAFHDVDEDGDLDLLVGSEEGSIAFVENRGTRTEPGWTFAAGAHPEIDVGNRSVPAVGDLDGDGREDLILGEQAGGLNVYTFESAVAARSANAEALAPGTPLQVTGTLRLHSQGITSGTDVEAIRVHCGAMFLLLNNADGDPAPAKNNFMSSVFTPTGLPIQGGRGPFADAIAPSASVEDLRVVGEGLIEGRLVASFSIPDDLPTGTYRPLLWIEAENVPSGTSWVAANVVRNTYSDRHAVLPAIFVADEDGAKPENRLIWRLMMDDTVLGTRGAGALEDVGIYGLSSQIVTQGAPFIVPPVDARTGLPIEYRIEPFLPAISFTDRRMPTPPLIPFDLPGGSLRVTIEGPDGTVVDLGESTFSQSFNRTKTTRGGVDLNEGTVQLEDVYSLMVDEHSYRVTFDQYGLYTITMTGFVDDIWGNRYEGGGTYEVWVAVPLDIDVGTLPGTPLAIGDAWNPMLAVQPRVPAEVEISVTQVPESNPARTIVETIEGTANAYGTFTPSGDPIAAVDDGEYRVDLFVHYTDEEGTLYAGAMTWGGVVMTPPNEAHLIAHGRRGLDSLQYIPNHWFVVDRDLQFAEGVVSHALNPYYSGDILWSGDRPDPSGASLVLGASVQDAVGLIEPTIRARAARTYVETYPPGALEERFENGEIPLFISTTTGRSDQLYPEEIDQIAYSYTYSERPGVRVREVVSQDNESGGYWRLNTLYDDQPGVGVLGDQPNDFKFQYVGTVYRDLVSGHVEYGGQGTGWVFIPENDALGNRVMPPFAGEGNGGWTTEGGPIMTLDGEEIDIFVYPTGVRPGTILEVGETFRFSGHVMPTLPSSIDVVVASPSGATRSLGGRANAIGYYYDPTGDFAVDEVGVWTVDVRVWHDGTCSGGATVPPYPSGSVLGSTNDRFTFYVASGGLPAIEIATPSPGFLPFEGYDVPPIVFRGAVPGASRIHYTITMPAVVLDQGEIAAVDDAFTLTFDPRSLHRLFPNLDLIGRDDHSGGLSDTFSIVLFAVDGSDEPVAASALTLQGERLFLGGGGAQ